MYKHEFVIFSSVLIIIHLCHSSTTGISNSTEPTTPKYSGTVTPSVIKENQNELLPEKTFQKLKHFVYPKVYHDDHTVTKALHKNHRNITTKAIEPIHSYALHLHSNQPLVKYSNGNGVQDNGLRTEQKYGDLELFDPIQRHNYLDFPPATNPGLLGSVTNLLDPLLPLLLMGVMTLVASLLTTVLGLLSQLNLTNAAAFTMKLNQSDQFYDKNALNHLLLNNLERILRISFDMYEKKLAAQESKF